MSSRRCSQPLTGAMTSSQHVYEIRPRKDKRGVNLISDVLPFGRLWYGEPNAIGYAKFYSRSHDAVIRVYDDDGHVIETRTSTRETSKNGNNMRTPAAKREKGAKEGVAQETAKINK
jgi:hypothetical protein